MLNQSQADCIAACNECATACLSCAAECLREPDLAAMRHCIELDWECAGICSLTAASMARGGAQTDALCALCAEACRACAQACGEHDVAHCQRCAAACRRCADACSAMSH